jgi:centromere/kinetochore protein ZW10
VLHNDSVFIANHCLTLGLEYKEKFPTADDDDIRGKLLKQTCVFVDMVPLFRELADSSMGDMLDLQQRQLADIVGSRISYFGKSLRSNESLLEWSEAETAIAAGIYHLRHLSQGWKPILAYSVFLRSMGYLIDVVVSLYLEQLMAATSISPSARYFVSALCQKAVVDLSGLLDTPKPAKYVPAWGRFVAVSKYLELNHLSDLEQALSYGVFRELGSQELCRLIQAGFPDSSERHALLSVLVSRS